MSELIDRRAFIEHERKLYCEDCDRRQGMKKGKLTFCYEIGDAPCRACWLDDVLTDLEDAPTIDAVPVVRCGECKWFIGIGHYCKYLREKIKRTDGYCSYGERREG